MVAETVAPIRADRRGEPPADRHRQVDRKPLRAEQWRTEDPVWWRPPGSDRYRRFTDADADELQRAFAEHGQGALAL